MKRMIRSKCYDIPKLCVICNAAPGTTDEHIIPRALGGRLIIENGTCKSCLRIIEKYEGPFLREYKFAQLALGIKTKKRRTLSTTDGIIWSDNFEKGSKGKVSLTDHAGYVILKSFRPPGIEDGRTPIDGFGSEIITTFVPLVDNSPIPMLDTFQTNLQTVAVTVAKIALAYWAVESPLGRFNCTLRDAVRLRNISQLGYLVGGCPEIMPTDDLHTIRHGRRSIRGRYWGYVDILLFAGFQFPNAQTGYRAYVGHYQ